MSIQKLNKEQKISLLKALAAGKITKMQIPGAIQMDKIFVAFKNHNRVKYCIAGEQVSEVDFMQRLEIARTILGEEVNYIEVKYGNPKECNRS